jgi:Ser/Thr protein kinase RdoA (MazF antagonist)
LSTSERALLQKAETSARQILSTTTRTPEQWGLIHSDLRPSNVMTDGTTLTIIDFDDTGYGWYLYDFGAALTFYEHRPEAPQLAANWIAGYCDVATLTHADRARAGALSMMRRLTMLGWATTHRADALPADLWSENLPGTVDVAELFLRDPLWLAGG